MTTTQILNLLDVKNQNLPALEPVSSFKGASIVFVPVIEDEEKKTKNTFSFAKKEKISGKNGKKTVLINKDCEYIFVGMGKRKEITNRKLRRFYGSSYLSVVSKKPKVIGMHTPTEWLKVTAEGIHVSALKSDILKSKKDKDKTPKVIFASPTYKAKMAFVKQEIKQGKTLAAGKNTMRILGAIPPNELSTKKYAEVIVNLAKKWKVKCERVSQKNLTKYNLLNAVSAGSNYDSELLIFTINPKKGKTKKSTAVIGKGLCYDSGGLQGKQNFMKFMKEDMAGSSSVVGLVYNIAHGGLNVKETTYFLLPLAENMMGSKAMRADDVYTAGDGQTVEIIHTDAEGRLALADAICYVKNNFKNTHKFYTIATLTGSCVVALGEVYTGVVCNNDELSAVVTKAGKDTGDHVHVGPWDMEYDDNNSPVADIANLGENQRDAGWIKAGMFLYKFVPKAKKEENQAKFCHLDIAGSIDMNEKGKAWRSKGLSSGVGVGLLTELLT